MAASFDPSTLQSFDHAAAGHDGVMTDEDNTVVIKPCTSVEIDFYEHATTNYPDLAYFMPRFMGTLQLQKSTKERQQSESDSIPPPKRRLTGDPNTGNLPDPLHLKGKAINTDTCIVLSAVTSGFKKPNVLDLKLGARLWAEDAPQAKRERLDKVSAETTSGPLGFRIAGMRVWQGEPRAKSDSPDIVYLSETSSKRVANAELDAISNYLIYNKMYGRNLPVDRITEGFENYFLVPKAGIGKSQALRLLGKYIEELKQIRDVLMSLETRMYSASVLLVYEGDIEAYTQAAAAEEDRFMEQDQKVNGASERDDSLDDGVEDEDEDEDDEDDGGEQLRSYAIKLIDFAHASSTPGQGPDENVLHGIHSILDLLSKLKTKLESS